ncbi:MAG: hypothetical protein HQ481_17625 [Alphaproteobacteria bacterium]|nr:hypothetical protein [Alphaproteobacteria bacterium]
MTLDEFRRSLSDTAPPSDLSPALQGLWWQGKGDWERAHQVSQTDNSEAAAWVHAHLHRVEGDDANAGYWFRRAGRPHGRAALDEEWAAIATTLLGDA